MLSAGGVSGVSWGAKCRAWEEPLKPKWVKRKACVVQTCQRSHSWLIKHRICLHKPSGGMMPEWLLSVMSCWCAGAPSLQWDELLSLLCPLQSAKLRVDLGRSPPFWFGLHPTLQNWKVVVLGTRQCKMFIVIVRMGFCPPGDEPCGFPKQHMPDLQVFYEHTL